MIYFGEQNSLVICELSWKDLAKQNLRNGGEMSFFLAF